MHRPPTERCHPSHLDRVPLVAIGPGGDYTTSYHFRGMPGSRSPGTLKPARKRPGPEPWNWRRFALAVLAGAVIGGLVQIGVIAIVAALATAH